MEGKTSFTALKFGKITRAKHSCFPSVGGGNGRQNTTSHDSQKTGVGAKPIMGAKNLNKKKIMEDIHEYNYQQNGYNKYVIDYTFPGDRNERTMKVYDKSEEGAKKQLREYWRRNGAKINFTHIYVC